MSNYGEFVLEQADCMDVIDDFNIYVYQEGFMRAVGNLLLAIPVLILGLFKGIIRQCINFMKGIKHSLDAKKHIVGDENGEVQVTLPGNMDPKNISTEVSNMKREVHSLFTNYTKALILTETIMGQCIDGDMDEYTDKAIDEIKEIEENIKKFLNPEDKDYFALLKSDHTTFTVEKVSVNTAQEIYTALEKFYNILEDSMKDLTKSYKSLEKEYNKIKKKEAKYDQANMAKLNEAYKSTGKIIADSQKLLNNGMTNISKVCDGLYKKS